MDEFSPGKSLALQMNTDDKLTVVGLPNGYTPNQARTITKARLQQAQADLINANICKVSKWLDQVAERNPAEAIRLLMEIQEFVTPKLKAAQVTANLNPTPEGAKRLADMSLEELQSVVAEG